MKIESRYELLTTNLQAGGYHERTYHSLQSSGAGLGPLGPGCSPELAGAEDC